MIEEKRINKRHSIDCYKLFIKSVDDIWHESELASISADGLQFISSQIINNENISFMLSMVSIINEYQISLDAKIIWQEKDDISNKYKYGVEFNDSSDECRERLHSLLNNNVVL